MENQESAKVESAPLSNQIFEAFIEELKTKEISKDIVSRLDETIVKNKSLSDQTIRAALFSESPAL